MINFLLKASKNKINEFINNTESFDIFDTEEKYLELIKKLEKLKLSEVFWDKFLHNNIDDKLIELLINKDYAQITLGHLDIADKWLFILSENVVEALQTLIVRYYTKGTDYYKSNNCSYDDFVDFINSIEDNKTFNKMLKEDIYIEWLKNLNSDSFEKRKYFLNYINSKI